MSTSFKLRTGKRGVQKRMKKMKRGKERQGALIWIGRQASE